MSYTDMLERVTALTIVLRHFDVDKLMPVDRRRLIEERQLLLTKLVAAGIIDNS